MSSYAKNTARPSTASVAQVEDPSGTDTHDPYDGNTGSLESGDAWDGAASGRVLTSGTPPTWEESAGGGGGSSNAGDRARMALDGTFDADLFVFPADFDDPQPNEADVPVGWSVVDGGLLLPAGAYWVRANWGGTMTENGTVICWPAFITDYNSSGAWGADADASTAVTDGQGITAYARGIVYTPAPDTLYLCPNGSTMTTATNINGSMLVTRIA